MILKTLSVSSWSIRTLKIGMAFFGVLLLLSACNNDDDDDLIGNWVKMGDFEGIPRSSAVAVVLGDVVYLGTGYNGEDDKERFNDIWEFTPSSESWRQKANMPAEALSRDGAVAFGAGGKVYLGTGYALYTVGTTDNLKKMKDFWEFDPANNVWSRVANFPGTARFGAVAFSIDDKGYVGTGYDDNELKDFWQYDPAVGDSGTWTQVNSFTGSKRRDAVAFVIDNKAYVCTGISNGTYVNDFYSYDPNEDKWTELRDIADISDDDFDDDYDDIVGTGGVAMVIDGKAYVCAAGRSSASSTVWEYNPASDLWNEKTGLEGSSRMDAVGFTVNGTGYVTTGRSSSYYFDDVWRFEPNAEQDDDDNY